MSYDLYFVSARSNPVQTTGLVNYLIETSPYFEAEKTDDGTQLVYHNEETGVYFSLDWQEPGTADLPPLPDGKYHTGLSFNLNFNRPTFFALEAMPFVEQIAQRFDLLVMDPQDHQVGGESLPKLCSASELIATWQKSNAWAVRVIGEQGGASPYLPRDQATLLWQYQSAMERLQHTYEDAFVPKQVVLKEVATGRLVTVITWTESIPSLFPPCDLVICGRQRTTLFGLKKKYETGIIAYTALMERIAPYLEDASGEVPGMKVLREGRHAEARPAFDALPLRSFEPTDYERVAMDGFVDEPSSV